MNIRYSLLLTLCCAAASCQTVQADDPDASVRIDCERRAITQADAARLLGTRNPWQTYHGRQRLYAQLARLCAGGLPTTVVIRRARQDDIASARMP